MGTVNFVKVKVYANKDKERQRTPDIYIYIHRHILPAPTLKFVCLPDNSDVTLELKTQNPNACNAALLSSTFWLEMCAWKTKHIHKVSVYTSNCEIQYGIATFLPSKMRAVKSKHLKNAPTQEPLPDHMHSKSIKPFWSAEDTFALCNLNVFTEVSSKQSSSMLVVYYHLTL